MRRVLGRRAFVTGAVAVGAALATGGVRGPERLTIRVGPSAALLDEALSVWVAGARPGGPVTVHALARYRGTAHTVWTGATEYFRAAQATFAADARGVVDLSAALVRPPRLSCAAVHFTRTAPVAASESPTHQEVAAMPSVRPFRREDREQVTHLVNLHVGAVLPGVSVSVNTVMGQLEREPHEPVVDPWVAERRTLVAVERDAVVAGALVHRYGSDPSVGEHFRDAAAIHWLVCRPDATETGAALVAACLAAMDAWGAARQYADGSLPSLATYGVPGCWPHLRHLYTGARFVHEGTTEVILVADVADLPRSLDAPRAGLTVHRSLGVNGTRFSAMEGDEELGFVEVEADYTQGGTRSRLAGWADVGNLRVAEAHRRRGIGTWLLAAAADWLRLGRVDRLLAYAWPEQTDALAFLAARGFRELTRTQRGWRRG